MWDLSLIGKLLGNYTGSDIRASTIDQSHEFEQNENQAFTMGEECTCMKEFQAIQPNIKGYMTNSTLKWQFCSYIKSTATEK